MNKFIATLGIFVFFALFACQNKDNQQNIKKTENINQNDSMDRDFVPDVFYAHYKGKWDNGHNIKISIKYDNGYVNGYLIFPELKLYYNLLGTSVDENNVEILAYGLKDSLGFMMNIVSPEKVKLKFYPPQSPVDFALEEDYDNSEKIEFFAVDTTYTEVSEAETFNYEISFQTIFFNHKNIDLKFDDFFYKNISKSGNFFYEEMLPEKTKIFHESLEYFAMDWYDYEYQEVLFNEYDILEVAKYTAGYTGGASTWSDEKIVIIDMKAKKQLTFYDIFDKQKKDELFEFITKNYNMPDDVFYNFEPVFYFNNQYFYFTYTSMGATRTGDAYANIEISELSNFFTKDFNENILSRF